MLQLLTGEHTQTVLVKSNIGDSTAQSLVQDFFDRKACAMLFCEKILDKTQEMEAIWAEEWGHPVPHLWISSES